MDAAGDDPNNDPPGTEQGDDAVKTVVRFVVLH